MTLADRTPVAIVCVDCHDGTGRPVGVRTNGPLRLDVTYCCGACGHEWAVAQQMPGFIETWTGSGQARFN